MHHVTTIYIHVHMGNGEAREEAREAVTLHTKFIWHMQHETTGMSCAHIHTYINHNHNQLCHIPIPRYSTMKLSTAILVFGTTLSFSYGAFIPQKNIISRSSSSSSALNAIGVLARKAKENDLRKMLEEGSSCWIVIFEIKQLFLHFWICMWYYTYIF